MRVMTSSDTAEAGATAGAAVTHGSIIARIERLSANSMLVRARVLIGMATFFDGFDVITIAAALPLLIHKWGLAPGQVAFLIGAGAIGQLVGAFVFPMLAGRQGRLRVIAWTSGIIGLTSIACGFAPTYTAFLALRFIQGVGLGGELPVAATYINEITRAHGRGRFVLLYELLFPIGLLVAMASSAWIVPRFGWEALYFIGGLPLILFFLIPRLVPESPRWLAERGRLDEADTAVARFEASAKGPLPQPADCELFVRQHPKRRLRDLFGPLYLKRTIAVAMLWATCGFIQYGLQTWLPTIYKTVYHAPLQLALNLTVIGSVVSVLGCLGSALIVDIVGRKPVISCSFVLCAIALVAAALCQHQSVYVVAGLAALALGLMSSGFITAYVYTPELYPTSIRAAGVGFGSAWLKIAAIFSPTIVSRTMGAGELDVAFYLFAVVPLLAAIAVHFLGIETKGQVLERLEA
jgi:putative MFS transporter